jgi:hypothetical protein
LAHSSAGEELGGGFGRRRETRRGRPATFLRLAASGLRVAPRENRRVANGVGSSVAPFEKFPKEPTVPYNLACYVCQQGRLDEARQWLERAVKIAGKEKIKFMALNDDDLQPLWEEIKRL